MSPRSERVPTPFSQAFPPVRTTMPKWIEVATLHSRAGFDIVGEERIITVDGEGKIEIED